MQIQRNWLTSLNTTQYINAINQLGNINTNAIRDCVSEYMNALTRVAGGKEKKEEKK